MRIKKNLIPELEVLFEITQLKEEVVQLISDHNQKQQRQMFTALKEVINDDISMIYMMYNLNTTNINAVVREVNKNLTT